MIGSATESRGFRPRVLACAAGLALLVCGWAKASPMLTLTTEASTTGTAGSYSNVLASDPAPGSTLYFEVVAQFASSGTTNANTGTKTPNGTTDSIVTLPNVILAADSGSTFESAALQNNFGTATSASPGTTGSNTIDFRAGETGYTEYADSPLVIYSGTLQVDSGFTGIQTESTGGTNGGSIRIAGSPTAISTTTETSSDPIVGYGNTTIAASPVPEPASLAIFGAAMGILLSRRRHA